MLLPFDPMHLLLECWCVQELLSWSVCVFQIGTLLLRDSVRNTKVCGVLSLFVPLCSIISLSLWFCHFLNVDNWPALCLFLFAQHCACFLSIFLSLLSGSLSPPHPPTPPPSSWFPLSSGSIKSLLICSFLLIWIHTGPNCWLGSAKETGLNEVYKTQPVSPSVCGPFLFTCACVWAVSCVCAPVFHWLLFQSSPLLFPEHFHCVTLIPLLPFSFLLLPHFLFLLSALHLNPFLKPSHLQIV